MNLPELLEIDFERYEGVFFIIRNVDGRDTQVAVKRVPLLRYRKFFNGLCYPLFAEQTFIGADPKAFVFINKKRRAEIILKIDIGQEIIAAGLLIVMNKIEPFFCAGDGKQGIFQTKNF